VQILLLNPKVFSKSPVGPFTPLDWDELHEQEEAEEFRRARGKKAVEMHWARGRSLIASHRHQHHRHRLVVIIIIIFIIVITVIDIFSFIVITIISLSSGGKKAVEMPRSRGGPGVPFESDELCAFNVCFSGPVQEETRGIGL
jgi:hypothetical protein